MFFDNIGHSSEVVHRPRVRTTRAGLRYTCMCDSLRQIAWVLPAQRILDATRSTGPFRFIEQCTSCQRSRYWKSDEVSFRFNALGNRTRQTGNLGHYFEWWRRCLTGLCFVERNKNWSLKWVLLRYPTLSLSSSVRALGRAVVCTGFLRKSAGSSSQLLLFWPLMESRLSVFYLRQRRQGRRVVWKTSFLRNVYVFFRTRLNCHARP